MFECFLQIIEMIERPGATEIVDEAFQGQLGDFCGAGRGSNELNKRTGRQRL